MQKFKWFAMLFIVFFLSTSVHAQDQRFGLDILRNISNASFESGNYRLDSDFTVGIGDTVKINLWGKLEAQHELTIDRDGNVVIPLIGRVSLLGLTLEKAREAIKSEIDKKYTNVVFDLSLTNVQDIRVEVLGNVSKPGVYAVSPFTRLVEVVARSGGPDDSGSLIDIQVIRDGKMVGSFNFYDFVKNADQTRNVRLKHNDVIFIPTVKNIVTIQGDLLYPGVYEIAKDETLKGAIELAGGIKKTTLKQKIYLQRLDITTKRKKIFKEVIIDNINDLKPEDNIALNDLDRLIVTSNFDFSPYEEDFFKSVSVSGAIQIPGSYLIKEGDTLSGILKKAGGLKDTAFAEGAVFIRTNVKEKQQSFIDQMVKAQKIAILEEEALMAGTLLSQQQRELKQMALEARKRAVDLLAARVAEGRIVIDLKEILQGNEDITLEKGDSFFVPPKPDWVLVVGEVYNAQSIAFKPGKPLDYYLNVVGGFKKTADRDEIYIIKPSGRTESRAAGFGKISMGDIIVVPAKLNIR